MLQVAYYWGLRFSELVGPTWRQLTRRDSGEARLSVLGKDDEAREVLIPAAMRRCPVGVRRCGAPRRAVHNIINGANPPASVHWLRHAGTSQALDNVAPIPGLRGPWARRPEADQRDRAPAARPEFCEPQVEVALRLEEGSPPPSDYAGTQDAGMRHDTAVDVSTWPTASPTLPGVVKTTLRRPRAFST